MERAYVTSSSFFALCQFFVRAFVSSCAAIFFLFSFIDDHKNKLNTTKNKNIIVKTVICAWCGFIFFLCLFFVCLFVLHFYFEIK